MSHLTPFPAAEQTGAVALADSPATPPRPTDARAARIASIRDAALVRREIGQGAVYRRLATGEHVVTIDGRIIVAHDLQAAIKVAMAQEAKT